jgi:V/A-type H+-transporting ATPase subunit D
MRLRERLRVADRGVELLDGKLRVLRAEQQRYHLAAERTGEQWRARAAEARAWLLRAALLGGQRAIRLAEDVEPADVRVSWMYVMGVRCPADAELRGGGPGIAGALSGTSAVHRAAAAHAAALRAAARHAVAEAAVRRIDAEVAQTRLRLRAVQDRWIPRLSADLREIEAGLEELEHAEGLRLRWVAGRRTGAARTASPRSG